MLISAVYWNYFRISISANLSETMKELVLTQKIVNRKQAKNQLQSK
jgi:hypothetical protein